MADERTAGADEEIAAEGDGHEANVDNASHSTNIGNDSRDERDNSIGETDGPSNTADDDHVIQGDHGTNDGEVHTENQQRDAYYISALVKSLTSMLLHCNSEHITAVRFKVAKDQTYLPLAGRMRSLKTISLPDTFSSIDMSQRYFSVLAQFIRLNQSVFPRKAPLNLKFGCFYYYYRAYSADYDDPSMLLEKDQIIDDALEFQQLLQGFKAAKERRRLHILETTYMRQYLEVYRAIARPRTMRMDHIPMAYEQSLKGSMDLHGSENWRLSQDQDEDGAIGLDR
ncbi:hypothetical protein EDD11_000444, partial [Mortierella claussenii]